MSYLYDELARDQGNDVPLAGVFAGRIAETATTVDVDVPVLLDGWDGELQFGPCRWMPRVHPLVVNVAEGVEATHNVTIAEVVLPTRGDPCLVCFDDSERPWIIVWRPA